MTELLAECPAIPGQSSCSEVVDQHIMDASFLYVCFYLVRVVGYFLFLFFLFGWYFGFLGFSVVLPKDMNFLPYERRFTFSSFRSTTKLSRNSDESPHACVLSPPSAGLYSALTQYITKSWGTDTSVYIRVCSWWCTSVLQVWTDVWIMYLLGQHQGSLSILKVLFWAMDPFPCLEFLEIFGLFNVSIALPFPECHALGITQYTDFSEQSP